MSYQAQFQLENDPDFNGRARAAALQQANVYKDDQRASWAALAQGVMMDSGGYSLTFVRMDAAGPGIADKAEAPNGGIDQSNITDADLLSLTQANWPIIAGLYFNEDGSPIT